MNGTKTMIEWLKRKWWMHRFGRVARNWPVERFLPTTDLELSEAERNELPLGLYAWRQLVPWYIARFGAGGNDEQIYCFGVAHGDTVSGLVTGFRNRGMKIPHMQLFDSFKGLPAEVPGVAAPPVWNIGAYSAPRADFNQKLQALNLPKDRYSVYEGWFKDTLDVQLVQSRVFKPAVYVDIDADLYGSTLGVLDFMFSNKLIRTGTLIGYDDWGDTDLWTAGESRAHKEIMVKYGARCAQLFSWGEPPDIRKLFLVVSAGQN